MHIGNVTQIEIFDRIEKDNVSMFKIFKLRTSMLTAVESYKICDDGVETNGCCLSLFSGLSLFSRF